MRKMMISRLVDRIGGLTITAQRDRRLLEQRFATLTSLMLPLYAILLVNLVALIAVVGGRALSHPLAWLLLGALTARLSV